MGKASRKKKERKHLPEVDYMARVENRLCLHCGAPLDWNEPDDLQGKPRTWHCRLCTARGRQKQKKYPSAQEVKDMAHAAVLWLESQGVTA